MSCEVCGSQKNVFPDHYEEHVEPPRVIDICKSCHTRENLQGKKYRKRGYVSNTLFGPIYKVLIHITNHKGKYRQYSFTLPKKVAEKLNDVEVSLITAGQVMLIVPKNRTGVLTEILPILPELSTAGKVTPVHSPLMIPDIAPDKVK